MTDTETPDATSGNGAPAPAATTEPAHAPQILKAPDGETLDEGAMIRAYHQAFNSAKELMSAASEEADKAQFSGNCSELELNVLRAREKRLQDRMNRISDVIHATPIRTFAGVLAKLRFADYYGEWSEDFANGDTSCSNALIVKILDDLEQIVASGG